jgi:uncharacterized iron-regulated membrane protein
MLQYRGPLARLIDPAAMLRRTPPGDLPLGPVIARMSRDATVTRLYFPEQDDGVYFLEMSGADGARSYATVDPGDGRVLKRGTILAFPLHAALRVHYQLGLGPRGTFLIFLNGCALLLLAATGLGYWWPRQGVLRSLGLRPQLRTWHRTGGVTAAAFLLTISATGLAMAGQEAIEGLAPAPPPTAVPPDRVDPALALAKTAFPQSRLRDIRLSSHAVRINFFAPADGPRAVHQVTIELPSLRIAKTMPAAANPALWAKLLPIHTGQFAGGAGQFLFLLAALALIALAITGPLLWWRGRRA